MAIATSPAASRRHARDHDHDLADAELREFELAAERAYRRMIGADDSLNDAAKKARRNSEHTPLAPEKPW